jgi:hypothetical protein
MKVAYLYQFFPVLAIRIFGREIMNVARAI